MIPKALFGWVGAVGGTLGSALICFYVFHCNATIAAIFLLLGVLLGGAYAPRAAAIASALTATLCLDYFFIPPVGKISIADIQGWIVLAVFLAVSIIALSLSTQLRRQRDELAIRQADNEKIHALNRAILMSDGSRELQRLLVNKAMEIFGFEEGALFEAASGDVYRSNPAGSISEAELRKAARYGSIETNGRITIVPVTLGNKIYGSFAFAGTRLPAALLQSLANTIAVGLAQAQTQEAGHRAEAIRRSEELKSVMIDALAHDLKTPLTAIEAAADLLHEGRVTAEQRADLTSLVRQEAHRLRRLMGEAIHLARIEAKRLKLERQVAAAGEVIQRAIDSLGQAASTHPIRLAIAEPAPTVFADEELMTQLLKQLIDNAMKYSPAGKPITVAVSDENGVVSIAVRDEGQGLTELEQSRVFDKFYRARRDWSAVQGTGMGLAIAREIAEAHGGALRVESQLGKGSVFTLALPSASAGALLESAGS